MWWLSRLQPFHNMRRFVVLILLLINTGLGFSQKYNPEIDSLLRVAESAGPDSAAVAYFNVGSSLTYFVPSDAIKYLQISIDCAKQNDDYRQLCQSNSYMGLSYLAMGYYNKSFEYFNQQLSLAINHKIPDEEVWANHNIAQSFLMMHNPDMSLPYLREALYKCSQLEDSSILNYISSNFGWYHLQKNQLDSARYYFQNTLRLRLKDTTMPMNIAATYRDLGTVFFAMGDFDRAKYYYKVSLDYADTSFSDINAEISVNLARMYELDGNLDSALKLAHKCIYISKKFHNNNMLRNGYGMLGRIYLGIGRYDKAEKYFSSQIAVTDSIRAWNFSHSIYDIEFLKEVQRQNDDIEVVRNNYKGNLLVLYVVLLLLAAGIVIAIRLRKKNVTIATIISELDNSENQLQASLNYAKRIQKAVMPNFSEIEDFNGSKFLIFEPKLTVSGDIHWYHNRGDYYMFAVGSCGRFGITGACLSMFASAILHDLARVYSDPVKIVEGLRHQFRAMMYRFDNASELIPNTDISIAVVDRRTMISHYCGVKFPGICIIDGKLVLVGDHCEDDNFFEKEIKCFEVDLRSGDLSYFITSGIVNQRNADGKALTLDGLCDLLLKYQDLDLEDQRTAILEYLRDWNAGVFDYDCTLAGFRIG